MSEEIGRVVALCADLMDRSKICAAFPDAQVVRSPTKLVQEAVGADLVLVDLSRLTDTAALLAIQSRIVAFGSHVDEQALDAAEDAGAEALPRSIFFRRLSDDDI